MVRKVCMFVGSRGNFWGAFTWNDAILSGISVSHVCFRITMAFLWIDAPSSLHMRMTTQNHVYFGGFGLVWFFVSARCKPVHSGDYSELFLDHEFKLWKRKSACLNWKLEVPHIACAVAMSPNKQHVKKHRQSGLGDIVLGVLNEVQTCSNDSRK